MNVAFLGRGRSGVLGIAAIAVAGGLLRAWPFLVLGNAWYVPVDYDDGVYFSAAMLTARGALPYRDFVFVHPPGVMLVLYPLAWLTADIDVSQVFTAARWLVIVAGTANIVLSSRLAYRAGGMLAAVAVAIFYAIYPESVQAERNVYLEPLLNFVCLLFANLWLSERIETNPRRGLLCGLVLAFAVTVKVWALIWVLACAASAPSRRSSLWLALGMGIGLSTFILPFALQAPRSFLDQTVFIHAWRPPDGIVSRVSRLANMTETHYLMTAFAVSGLCWHVFGRPLPRGRRARRFFVTAFLLVYVAFLTSPVYWQGYNAHLAIAEVQLAGLGVVLISHAFRPRPRLAMLAVIALILIVSLQPAVRSLGLATERREAMPMVGAAIRRLVPHESCLFVFEPVWGISAGRLPSWRAGTIVIVDPYAAMLIEAMRSNEMFQNTQRALHTDGAQKRVRDLIERCEWVSMGARGEWQLTAESQTWLRERYEQIQPPIGDDRVDLWKKK